MTQKITRKRALEIAQECIQKRMQSLNYWAYAADETQREILRKSVEKDKELYAELAAALAYIENLARQKELL